MSEPTAPPSGTPPPEAPPTADPPPARPLALEFAYQEGEFVAAMRCYLSERLKPRSRVPLAAAVAFVSLVLLALGRGQVLSVLLLLAATAMLGLHAAAFWIWPRRTFRREPSFADTFRLTLGDDGLALHDPGGQTARADWDTYSHLIVHPLVYVLVAKAGHFTAIPRRALAGEAERRTFLGLVRDHVAADRA